MAEEEQLKNISQAAPTELNAGTKKHYQIGKEEQKLIRQLTRRIEALETEMAELESTIQDLENQLTLPEVFGNHVKVQEINQILQELKEKNETSMNEWEEQSLALEELGDV